MTTLKDTVAAEKKILPINAAKSKAVDMEASPKIIFDDDEDLYVQSAAIQSYLFSLEDNSVKAGAIGACSFNCYTLANGNIYSGASANFVTLKDKFRIAD